MIFIDKKTVKNDVFFSTEHIPWSYVTGPAGVVSATGLGPLPTDRGGRSAAVRSGGTPRGRRVGGGRSTGGPGGGQTPGYLNIKDLQVI